MVTIIFGAIVIVVVLQFYPNITAIYVILAILALIAAGTIIDKLSQILKEIEKK